MRVALISPHGQITPLADAAGAWPPLGLGYLAASLNVAGHEVLILDAHGTRMTDKEVVSKCREFGPRLVGLSMYSIYLRGTKQLSQVLRKEMAEATLIGGGYHATLMPAETLKQFEEFDYLLCGEAEDSIVALCRFLDGQCHKEDVPGLVYREGERAVLVPIQEQTTCPSMPPDRPWLSQGSKHSPYFSILCGHVDSVITSRGCPYHCGFCCPKLGGRPRRRTAESIIEELVELRRRGIRNIDIQDDTFTANTEAVTKFLELLAKENLHLRFRIRARANHITDDIAALLKRVGVTVVSVGMESGSQKMLDAMNKGTTVELNEKAAKIIKEHRMWLTTSWVVGCIGETPETINETIDFVRRIRPTTAIFYKLIPLPGTEQYRMAKQQGRLRGCWTPSDEWPWVQLDWMKDRSDLDAAQRHAQNCYRPDWKNITCLGWKYIPSISHQVIRSAFRISTSLLVSRISRPAEPVHK